jgi:hypothetical protein
MSDLAKYDYSFDSEFGHPGDEKVRNIITARGSNWGFVSETFDLDFGLDLEAVESFEPCHEDRQEFPILGIGVATADALACNRASHIPFVFGEHQCLEKDW